MSEHLLTGQHMVVHVECGNWSCGKWWDQPGVDLNDPGSLVCPHCNFGAPTGFDRHFAEALERARGAAA